MNDLISVIIVNFDSLEYLLRCLDSVQKSMGDLRYEVIVYDNGPIDEQLPRMTCGYHNLKLISPARFIPFAAANNAAVSNSTGQYLLLLNPDTLINEKTVQELLQFMAANPNCAIAAPKLIDGNGIPELSYGRDPGILSEAHMKFLSRLPARARHFILGGNAPKEVQWVSAAAMIVSRAEFDSVNGFDEGFPLYFEDSDLCLRMRKKGHKIFYLPYTTMTHYRGKAGGEKAEKRGADELSDAAIKYRQGQLKFYSKHRGELQNSLLKFYLKSKFGKYYESFQTGGHGVS